MKEQIVEKLKQIEENLRVYDAFRTNPSSPKKDVGLVSFAFLYELMAFTALHELVPDYEPALDTNTRIAKGLGGVHGFVKVVDGKVNISPEYDQMLIMKEQLLSKSKNNGNGKMVESEGKNDKN